MTTATLEKTFEATVLGFSLFEADLGVLSSQKYPSEYTNLPDKSLPDYYQAGLKVFLESLGATFNGENNAATIRFLNGKVSLYGPTLYRSKEGKVIIRYGNQEIPFVPPVGGEISWISKGEKDFIDLFLNIDYADSPAFPDGLTVLVKFGPKDLKNKPEVQTIKAAYRKGTLADLLAENPGGGSTMKLYELPLGEYTVTGYDKKELTDGPSYRLFVKGADANKPEESVAVYANTSVRRTLELSPRITPTEPVKITILEVKTTRAGKQQAVVEFIVPSSRFPSSGQAGGLDLSFLG
jgi:hypothetical protein